MIREYLYTSKYESRDHLPIKDLRYGKTFSNLAVAEALIHIGLGFKRQGYLEFLVTEKDKHCFPKHQAESGKAFVEAQYAFGSEYDPMNLLWEVIIPRTGKFLPRDPNLHDNRGLIRKKAILNITEAPEYAMSEPDTNSGDSNPYVSEKSRESSPNVGSDSASLQAAIYEDNDDDDDQTWIPKHSESLHTRSTSPPTRRPKRSKPGTGSPQNKRAKFQ